MSRPDHAPQCRDRDLDDPTEIAEMVRRFYADVAQDDTLGPMFNEVARVDWPEHLAKVAAFWCRALLSRSGYEGNPYRAHLLVNARRPFTREHFVRWLDLSTRRWTWAGTARRPSGPKRWRARSQRSTPSRSLATL
jgi:hemoglobin